MKKALYLFAIAILGPALMAAAKEAYNETETVADLYADSKADVSLAVSNAITQMADTTPQKWIEAMLGHSFSISETRNKVAKQFLLETEEYEAAHIDAALAIINLI